MMNFSSSLKRLFYFVLGCFLFLLGVYVFYGGLRNFLYIKEFNEKKMITTARVAEKIQPLSKYSDSCEIVFVFQDTLGGEFKGKAHVPRADWDNIRTSSFLKITYKRDDPSQSMLPHQLKQRSNPMYSWLRFIGGVLIAAIGIIYWIVFRK